jgi:DNA ligase-associated metallophosphoesterase
MRSFATCEIAGQRLHLLAGGGVYWTDQETLLVADTHFGKSATFRRHHVPVPRGATRTTLATIGRMLVETQAQRLVLLGDFFHARSSASAHVLEDLDSFFSQHANVDVWLCLGNHDRNIERVLNSFPMQTRAEFVIDRVRLCHFPSESDTANDGQRTSDVDLQICGHLHPAIHLANATDRVPKLPCFWLNGNQLILPAVGDFTGTHAIDAREHDRVWVLVEDEVIEVTQQISA